MVGTLVAMQKTIRSHCCWRVAIQCLAPNAWPPRTTDRYMAGIVLFCHSVCSTHVTYNVTKCNCNWSSLSYTIKHLIISPSLTYPPPLFRLTLQWPLAWSSIMQPEGFFLHLTSEVSMLCSILSTDTSKMAHFSALSFLLYLMKYNSLVGTSGVSICSSANI